MLNLLKKFLPDEHVKSVFEIDADLLLKRGIKGIITDLDNTLVEWDRPDATPELIKWFQHLEEKGIIVTIVSNNNQQRVGAFAEPLNVPFIYHAKKPMTRAFKQALTDMKLQPTEIVVIGDQIFTDVLGGNRLGLHTILVVPVASTDGFITKFNRRMERVLLGKMKKKGLIHWEEEK
ncbi:YqeG family HAD IIIA-type phosphatase [Bacillus taeanensis]|uniref:YqeG family HAD IIIA-type phosphatase n=1 Tax=Bacillus taeanensis TaxID=273032 RepID=A0A366Y2M7_9BACI|nr:YqeG family HAD IIIA-type phosphatase [Bacillus taeanensis]